jgi:hypothetical protein
MRPLPQFRISTSFPHSLLLPPQAHPAAPTPARRRAAARALRRFLPHSRLRPRPRFCPLRSAGLAHHSPPSMPTTHYARRSGVCSHSSCGDERAASCDEVPRGEGCSSRGDEQGAHTWPPPPPSSRYSVPPPAHAARCAPRRRHCTARSHRRQATSGPRPPVPL